jgi:glycosyltransferase involved in cell wall biosynthesis
VSATVAHSHIPSQGSVSELGVTGVLNPRSYGVARYAARLAEALAVEGVRYALEERPVPAESAHFHLANSSRALLGRSPRHASAYVVTVHDVVPRTRALLPLYRALAYPRLARSAAVVVHSRFAADMLVRTAGRRPQRLEVIEFPAQAPVSTNRDDAREALAWPADALIAVLPGVLKSVKLVREAIAGVSKCPGWRLALVGRLQDRALARAARTQGALVLANPGDREYEQAIVAADCVLCMRAGSVGETNAPLLEALGAGRAILATETGSIPEVARSASLYCDGTVAGIATGLASLGDPSIREELERAARDRASELTWSASAAAHASLFHEVFT